MSKWADYLISGVWKDMSKRITDVKLHVDDGETVSTGIKRTEAEVIRLLKDGKTVETTTWSYPNWTRGAKVIYEERNGREFLTTVANATVRDNLDNSIIHP